MTEHLRPDQFVDALEGALPAEHAAHLELCDACRAELERLRTVHGDLLADDIPEPSPLFWEHFSARVHEATAREPIAAASWWRAGWRPVVALGAAAAVILAFLTPMRQAPAAPAGSSEPAVTATDLAFEDDGSWDIVMDLASGVAWEDLREAVVPVAGAADAAIEELTAAQREALVRLLKQEIGE